MKKEIWVVVAVPLFDPREGASTWGAYPNRESAEFKVMELYNNEWADVEADHQFADSFQEAVEFYADRDLYEVSIEETEVHGSMEDDSPTEGTDEDLR